MKKLIPILLLLSCYCVQAQQISPQVNSNQRSLEPQTISAISNNSDWDEIEAFHDGFARVLKGERFTFIDQSGRAICPPSFEAARNFSNGLAAVQQNGKWGFINNTGVLVIPARYEIVFDFSNNTSAVLAGKRWQLINKGAVVMATPDIDVCYGFKNGIAKIGKGGKVGTMTESGVITMTNELVPVPSTRRNAPATNSAASDCPPNIDFEEGTLTNWNCFIGSVDSVGTTNVIAVTPSAPINNRHRVYPRTMPSALDPFGLFPINPPDGSNYAVKLGNTNIGAQAERIQYVLHVPLNDSNFSLKYDYAVVFQDPGHTEWTQPRFIARLFDSAANAYVSCASFEYISTTNLPGFAMSTVDTSVIYKPWSSVFISLRGYAGKTMYLEFTTADCVRRGHWGYAYVDVESTCGNSIDVQYDCSFSGTATLDAPPGFEFYNWWNQNFTSTIATGQHVVLNPAPPANSTVWVEMVPYNDFGCRDTLKVTLEGGFTPHFTASDTVVTCAPHGITFYNTDIPSANAVWDFGDGTPQGSGDTITHVFTLPGTYMVTLTVTLPSGCTGTTQHTVTVLQPTASIDYAGGTSCNSRNVRFDAVFTNVNGVIWDFGDGTTLSSMTAPVFHTYATPGVYVPNVTVQSNGGCEIQVPGIDTISIEQIVAGFTYTQQPGCSNTAVNFTDTSHSLFGIASYSWDFGDGTTGSGDNTSHSYSATGVYDVQLIVTGVTGCKDTIVQQVNVNLFAAPSAFISGPRQACVNSQSTFVANITSTDPVTSILWNSNGTQGSSNNFDITYTAAGSYDVQLIVATANGCADTTETRIIVNDGPVVDQPADQTICNGAQTTAVVFTSNNASASFDWTNDFPSIGLAASGSGDIAAFTGVNNGSVPAIANITVSATANGCPSAPVSFSITVQATPVMSQPSDQQVCNGGTTAAIIFSSFARNMSMNANFTWTNDQPSIGLASSGSGNIPPFTATNNGTAPITATIIITPSDNGCVGNPVTFHITVDPTPVMDQPSSQAICNGSSSSAITFTSTSSAIQYSWTNDQPSIGLGASGTGDIPTFTATNTGSSVITATIAVTPVVNGCNGDTKYLTITVSPTPNVDQPADQTVCHGAAINPIHFTGLVSNTVYDWSNSLTSIGLAANGDGDIPAFNPINNELNSVTATITVTPGLNGCMGTPKDFAITVLPWANLVQPLNQFLCDGQNSPVMTFVGTLSNTSFTWTNDNTAIGLPATGTGSIPSFPAVNTGNTAIVATITVTASANGCPGNTKTFTMQIDPTPDMAQPANQVLCNNAYTGSINFTSTVANTNFTWINSNTDIGLPANGTGNIPPFLAVNPNPYPITATITVIGSVNSCSSVARTFTITVDAMPGIDPVNDQFVCNGIRTSPIPLTGTVPGTVYTWTNNNPSIGLPASGTGDIPGFLATNAGSTPVIATINVYATTANTCQPTGTIFKITVNPTPGVAAGGGNVICRGSNLNLTVSGAAQYSWSPSTGLSCVDCPNPTATPTDPIQYVVEGISIFGCRATDTIQVEVIQPFDMLVNPGDTICAGRSINLNAMYAQNYSWSPSTGLSATNIANPVATPTANTQYQVIGYDNHHCFTDTGYVNVSVGPNPLLEIGPDITASTGSTVTLSPQTQNGPIVSWSWSPSTNLSCSNCPNPTVTVANNQSYVLSVTNSYGCVVQDTVDLFTFCKGSQVFVPNAFTPDGDGLNDVLMIRGIGVQIKSFRVFNGWGVLIFEKQNFNPNEPRYGWDGKVRGVPATPDVYVYTAEVVCDNGLVYTYKGNTTILK